MDWLAAHNPPSGVTIESLTNTHTILVVAGPKSRDVLAAAAPRTDWSSSAFPWLNVRYVYIGYVEAVAMSVSFSGELAWELHIPNSQLIAAYTALMEAGAPHGIGQFGLYATESMRLEKGYRHWKADLITEFNPFESGLDRFVKMDKGDFVGRAALEQTRQQPKRRGFVSLVLDSDTAPAHPGDSILSGDTVVGTVTSAGFGYRVQENLAMGFVDPQFTVMDTELDVLVLGERLKARVVPECRYDEAYVLVRA